MTERRWIPVTERLPEDGSVVWVIVQDEDGDRYHTTAEKIGKEQSEYFYGSPWFICEDDLHKFQHKHIALCITHWMPIDLPSFPEPIHGFSGYACDDDQHEDDGTLPRPVIY